MKLDSTKNGDSKNKRRRPPRLAVVFQRYDVPLYFVTFCTLNRQQMLDNEISHRAFIAYAQDGIKNHGVAVGRYVIMPEHVHLFVRSGREFRLSYWVRGLKRTISNALKTCDEEACVWQEGFFDHLLRTSESYADKWEYVRNNPVRKGLVRKAELWPYAGEIVRIDRV